MNYDPNTLQPMNTGESNENPGVMQNTVTDFNVNAQPISQQDINQSNIDLQNVNFSQNLDNDISNVMENPQPVVQTTPSAEQMSQGINSNTEIVENQQATIQNIPTVEQTNQNFVSNTQAISSEKKVEKKAGINYFLVIILFLIVVAAIYFVFPLLKNYI